MAGETGASGAARRPAVLLVDDEPALLELYAAFLDAAGYAVRMASNGREAMTALSQERFDAVLSDIVMPQMDGTMLLRAVREGDLDVPVLLMTANPRLESALQAVEYGALQYLVKPVSEAALRAAVGKAVRLHRIAKLKREFLERIDAGDMLLGDRAGLEAHFERALRTLWMAYQPIVRAEDGRLHGHEALLRTAEPYFPNPGPLLEAAGRLRRLPDLGRAVRGSVASFVDGGVGGTVFVNLHVRDLLDEQLFSCEAPLSRHARKVVLEITERAALDEVEDATGRVSRLRELGFKIALDDLGAGYAGLTSFANLAPDVVKLDMALVRGCDADPLRRRLIGSLAALCRDLGILVVAEGVETEAERETVAAAGCDLMQGFFVGVPGPMHARGN